MKNGLKTKRKNKPGAGAPRKAPTTTIAFRVHLPLAEPLKKIVKEYIELNDKELCKKKNTDNTISGWVNVTDSLPKPLQTVWLANNKGWIGLGCLIKDSEGCSWAQSNGVIYTENGEIVSECESEDLDVNFW